MNDAHHLHPDEFAGEDGQCIEEQRTCCDDLSENGNQFGLAVSIFLIEESGLVIHWYNREGSLSGSLSRQSRFA